MIRKAVDRARQTLAGHPHGDTAPHDLVLAWLANRAELHASDVLLLVENINGIEALDTGPRGVANDYAHAFYDAADMLGIAARPDTPANIWKNEMRPRLQALINGAPDTTAERRGYQAATERAAKIAEPPLAHRKGKIGLWRQRRMEIAALIRGADHVE